MPRAALDSSLDVDVAIVGGGLSGLWTARYLLQRDPGLRVAVLERSYVGFGASGRNGGWVSALFPVPLSKVRTVYGDVVADELMQALDATVDEVARQVVELGIDCDFAKAGTLLVARNRPQWARLRAAVTPPAVLLDARGARQRLKVSKAIGALYQPQCATVQPAKLVRGLADRLEKLGVRIYEETEVTDVGDHLLRANGYRVRAGSIVLATESYTSQFKDWRRTVLPLYSMMVVTEPLSDGQFEAIGSPQLGLSFSDERNMVIYGQITADRRIAFGGRGAPYGYGSVIAPAPQHGHGMRARLEQTVRELFPELSDVGFADFWGGTLGVTRDWFPRVEVDSRRGLTKIYGYAGDGVAMTNLMGRLVAQQVLSPATPSVVGKVFARPPRLWEPEPLRYLGINIGLALTQLVDVCERWGVSASMLDTVRRTLIGQLE
ncbi:MAG: NAD(P)/FAD-dependent oxidoreductase [Ferrimicrobium sp.]|uniref:FAD-dependent oxidoreductase n=1 Tax=Ferrimicrobium acidiphilum TaxID=121039 RepID=A0ABV3Y4U3_9ACTN|nr:FAD-dependent oxidoreductase [Ferrimicrobium sp.]